MGVLVFVVGFGPEMPRRDRERRRDLVVLVASGVRIEACTDRRDSMVHSIITLHRYVFYAAYTVYTVGSK